jgi:hypothetical protein
MIHAKFTLPLSLWRSPTIVAASGVVVVPELEAWRKHRRPPARDEEEENPNTPIPVLRIEV